VGIAIVNLGGGRAREDDVVDHSVGLTEVAALGERVEPGGRPLALLHARDEESARRAARAVRAAFVLGEAPGEVPGPVIEVQRTV
jgi:thymidine phosphorylase